MSSNGLTSVVSQPRALGNCLSHYRFCREMSEAAALKLLTQQVPAIVEWCDRYMHSEPVEEKGSSNCKV